MKKFFILFQYIRYFTTAKSAHNIHSPFVFEFINEVLKDQRHFYAFEEIQKLRKDIASNHNQLSVEDMGAGSHLNNTRKRRISDIGKTAGRNQKFGELLFRIVQKYRPETILELGTSLGLGSCYLSMARSEAQLFTIEGSAEIAAQAAKHFAQLKISNIQSTVGNFDNVLGEVLTKMGKVDLMFVDGNHRKEPTIRYFNEAKPFFHQHTIVIFDDIHWSAGMLEAWKIICEDASVTLSIDLFFFGIVFFRNDFKEKQHFVLRY